MVRWGDERGLFFQREKKRESVCGVCVCVGLCVGLCVCVLHNFELCTSVNEKAIFVHSLFFLSLSHTFFLFFSLFLETSGRAFFFPGVHSRGPHGASLKPNHLATNQYTIVITITISGKIGMKINRRRTIREIEKREGEERREGEKRQGEREERRKRPVSSSSTPFYDTASETLISSTLTLMNLPLYTQETCYFG